MTLAIYQVDAFTSRLYGGNPAAIVPLDAWLPDAEMQSIAAENNLAETAYFVPQGDGYHLRWFTPAVEVDLCGHATLAAALVLYECLGYAKPQVSFASKSGPLAVTRDPEGVYWLDFPSRPPVAITASMDVLRAVGGSPKEVLAARDQFLVYETEKEVRALKPDMTALGKAKDVFAAIATAPGTDCDFVSRFFAPGAGIPEDPVTGSAHCELIPYWAARLGKTKMFARQISARGGEIWCEHQGDRVRIGGRGVLYLKGEIYLAR